MNLQDYHRENLLNGGLADEDDTAPLTYNQEQEQLKKSIVKEIHATEGADSDSSASESGKGFLVAKQKPKGRKREPVLDVDNARQGSRDIPLKFHG